MYRIEKNKYLWHAKGYSAKYALQGMYKFPSSLVYSDILEKRLSNRILLLQSTLPEKMNEIRDFQSEKFQNETRSIVKKIEKVSHLLHWDNPNLVVNEILNWFS